MKLPTDDRLHNQSNRPLDRKPFSFPAATAKATAKGFRLVFFCSAASKIKFRKPFWLIKIQEDRHAGQSKQEEE